jgi:hypothetical protein
MGLQDDNIRGNMAITNTISPGITASIMNEKLPDTPLALVPIRWSGLPLRRTKLLMPRDANDQQGHGSRREAT